MEAVESKKEIRKLLSHETEVNDHLRNRKRFTYTFSTQPVETDLKELLSQVTGTMDLPGVTGLKLKVLSGQAGLHRLSNYTPRLTSLNLDGSCIASLRDLGSSLEALATLSVARCNMRHLDGVCGFPNLRELDARDNFLSDPSPCSGVRKLSKLDFGNNQITDVSYFAFLRSCRQLRYLNIAANNLADYREEIRAFLPQLRILDDQVLENCSGQTSTEEGSNLSSEDGSSTSLIAAEDEGADIGETMKQMVGEEKGEKEEENIEEAVRLKDVRIQSYTSANDSGRRLKQQRRRATRGSDQEPKSPEEIETELNSRREQPTDRRETRSLRSNDFILPCIPR